MPGEQAWPGERFSHEALAVVLQVRRDSMHVLLWRRAAPPFEGLWALPGGPLGAHERLGTSVGRHLAAKVDLTDIAYMEQLETRSDPGRDPRGRVLATAYLALISADVEPRIPSDTAWHCVQDLPPTAFDHGSIAESGRDRLRAKLSYTNIGFALAPETFTIAQLTGHLRRLGRPSGLGDQPAAGPDPPRRHRGHARGGPTHVPGRTASYALPVRGPDPDRHQSLCRVPPPGGQGRTTSVNRGAPSYEGRVAARSALRPQADILRFFDGFDLIDPGLVYLPEWRPDSPDDVPEDPRKFWGLVGVARRD